MSLTISEVKELAEKMYGVSVEMDEFSVTYRELEKTYFRTMHGRYSSALAVMAMKDRGFINLLEKEINDFLGEYPAVEEPPSHNYSDPENLGRNYSACRTFEERLKDGMKEEVARGLLLEEVYDYNGGIGDPYNYHWINVLSKDIVRFF